MTLFNWFKRRPSAPATPPADPLPEWVQRLIARMADPDGWTCETAEWCEKHTFRMGEIEVEVSMARWPFPPRIDKVWVWGLSPGDPYYIVRATDLKSRDRRALSRAVAKLYRAVRTNDAYPAAFAAALLERLPPKEAAQ